MIEHLNTSISLESAIKDSKIRYKKSDAVKYLESLVFEAKRKRYPSIKPEYLAKAEFTDKAASGLTKCITSFIQLKGGQAERINTTGRAIDRQTTFSDVTGRTRTIGRIEWIPGTSTNGSSDISATLKGRSVKIEVKIGRDHQSQAQKDYEQAITKAGGIYYIAHDFKSFLTWYNSIFEL